MLELQPWQRPLTDVDSAPTPDDCALAQQALSRFIGGRLLWQADAIEHSLRAESAGLGSFLGSAVSRDELALIQDSMDRTITPPSEIELMVQDYEMGLSTAILRSRVRTHYDHEPLAYGSAVHLAKSKDQYLFSYIADPRLQQVTRRDDSVPASQQGSSTEGIVGLDEVETVISKLWTSMSDPGMGVLNAYNGLARNPQTIKEEGDYRRHTGGLVIPGFTIVQNVFPPVIKYTGELSK